MQSFRILCALYAKIPYYLVLYMQTQVTNLERIQQWTVRPGVQG